MSRVQKSSRLTKVWVHDEWYDMKKKIIKHKTHKRGSSHFSISIFCCIRKKILRDFCWDTISFLGQGNIIVVDWNNNFRLTLSLVHLKISRLGSSMKKVVDHRGICLRTHYWEIEKRKKDNRKLAHHPVGFKPTTSWSQDMRSSASLQPLSNMRKSLL